MSLVQSATRNRTFVALTYFELAYLLVDSDLAIAAVRDVLPLPSGSDPAQDYLETGRALFAVRKSALPEGDTTYPAVIALVLNGLESATSSAVLSLGESEPTVVAVFRAGDITIELVVLPGGQLLLGALSSVTLRETVVSSYLIEVGADSMKLLASRDDQAKLWLSCSDNLVRVANGDSFDLSTNGPTWRDAAELIIGHVDNFLNNR